MDLVVELYEITTKFPKSERYGLVNQIRRAGVSVPSNIAEGTARQTDNEYIQFLYIALGSLKEMETQLIIALKLNYMDEESFNMLKSKVDSVGRLLVGLIKYLKNK